MSSPRCRWGILGTANIARKNWKGIHLAGNAVLTAVASRDPARARSFIEGCQSDVPFSVVPEATTYEELLDRKDIDAVYIPLPTGIRPEWVIRAAKKGKHVLSEKPCGGSAADVQPMIDACRDAGVQFMDGVMFMHSQRLPLLRQVLDDGQTVGTLRRMTTQFSFAGPNDFLRDNIRVNAALEPLGCLGDLGWYNIRFALWAMNYLMPERVSGRVLTEAGVAGQSVPIEFSGELFFTGGVSTAFYCSFLSENQQWVHLNGSKGSVYLNDFVLPFFGAESAFEANTPFFNVVGCSFNMESHPRRFAIREHSDGAVNSQETNMIRTFSDIVLTGKPDPFWPEIALKTQVVLDACLRSARDGSSLLAPG